MRIKKLTANGLKIGDFTHDMEAVNIITGRNFSGKTARLDAIRLGLLGYLPELGKQASATAALARNGSMSVELGLHCLSAFTAFPTSASGIQLKTAGQTAGDTGVFMERAA